MLRSEALDEIIGVLGEADLERTDDGVRADPVEDDVPASALERDEARQSVDELFSGGEPAFVENVGPVEDEEHVVLS